VTRRLPPEVWSGLLSAGAFGSMGIAGLVLLLIGGQQAVAPTAGQGALMAATLCFGLLGYITMVIATRIAEISVIAPFRYSRLLFAMLLAVTIFGERPDALTLLGAALIAGAGIYAMWREARLRRALLAAL
jgi:drug/metabolite transporter (DMT)-like permease